MVRYLQDLTLLGAVLRFTFRESARPTAYQTVFPIRRLIQYCNFTSTTTQAQTDSGFSVSFTPYPDDAEVGLRREWSNKKAEKTAVSSTDPRCRDAPKTGKSRKRVPKKNKSLDILRKKAMRVMKREMKAAAANDIDDSSGQVTADVTATPLGESGISEVDDKIVQDSREATNQEESPTTNPHGSLRPLGPPHRRWERPDARAQRPRPSSQNQNATSADHHTDSHRRPYPSPPSSNPIPSTLTQIAPRPPLPKPKEKWQIDKAAHQNKFGSEPWNPRKKLSPDTLSGIRALHSQYPEQYTVPVLAEQFKISPEAMRRIVKKSHWEPDEAKMQERRERWARRHDRIWDLKATMGLRPPRRENRKARAPEDVEAMDPQRRERTPEMDLLSGMGG